MDELKSVLKKLLGDEIFILDVKEDPHSDKLQIIIDSEEPVTLDMTTKITKIIRDSGEIDRFYHKDYRLEVSSPGIGSNLSYPFQFRKNINRSLTITTKDGDGEINFHATLLEIDNDGIVVSQQKRNKQRIAYDDIVKATVDVSFH